MRSFISPVTLLLLLSFYSALYSQQYEDVIHLKNKINMKGTIVEQLMTDQIVKLKIAKGDTLTFKFSEIDKISRLELKTISGAIIGFGGGIALPIGGDPKDYSGSGFTVYNYEGGLFSRYFGFRIDLQFSSFKASESPEKKIDGNYMSFAPMLDFLGGNFNTKSHFIYYGLAGIGVNVYSIPKIYIRGNDSNETKQEGSGEGYTKMGFHIGAGAGYRLFGSVTLTAELQINFIGSGSKALTSIPIRFGLSFLPK